MRHDLKLFSEFLSDLKAAQTKAAIEKHRDYFDAALRAHEANAPSIAAMGPTDQDQDWSTENRWDYERDFRKGDSSCSGEE